MTAPSREEVEALIAHYDERVAQHEALKNGPAGKLRTERGEATAQVHRDTAETLRALLAQRERYNDLLRNPVRADDGFYDYLQHDVDAALAARDVGEGE